MSSRVKNRLFDVEGQNEQVDSIVSTGFAEQRIKDIFAQDFTPESWRVGETLAECFLEDNSDIRFPWNGVRDQKVDSASLPGADLIGFKGTDGNVRFLFGEVKTSNDTNQPPNVMYGRSGMTKQLEELKTDSKRRDSLVKWFSWRAKGSNWEVDYTTALKLYCSSDECVFLQGVLVRDTSPVINDLKSRGVSLSTGKPAQMGISLSGIYCPCSIADFPALIGGAS